MSLSSYRGIIDTKDILMLPMMKKKTLSEKRITETPRGGPIVTSGIRVKNDIDFVCEILLYA